MNIFGFYIDPLVMIALIVVIWFTLGMLAIVCDTTVVYLCSIALRSRFWIGVTVIFCAQAGWPWRLQIIQILIDYGNQRRWWSKAAAVGKVGDKT